MGRKKFTAQHDFIASIVQAELSPVTKRVYLERMKYMLTQLKVDVLTILRNPRKYIGWIRETFDALATQKSYISAVLAVFRHNEGLKQQEQKHYDAWHAAFKEVDTQIDERYKRNEPSERQANGFVPFEEIVEKRDQLEKGSDERLLLCVYTYIPPLRADWNRVRIYTTSEVPNEIKEENYIVMDEKKRAGKLILREFKTATKHTQYEKELPIELVTEILANLDKNPRDFLFQDRNGAPYRASSYTKWANRILQRLFNRPLTISLIRHAYINTLDFNALTVHEKEVIARDMAHTIGTQDRYRLIFHKPPASQQE